MMQTGLLAYFKEAAERESFTQAAKDLGVSQPFLSKAIHQLEESLDVSLFDRNGRRVSLNDYGKTLLQSVQTVEDASGKALREISRLTQRNEQQVRFVARGPLGNFAKTLMGFYQLHPNRSISYTTPGADLAEIDYDLEYFCSSKSIAKPNVRRLCNEDFVLLVPATHPLASCEYIHPSQLRNTEFILSPLQTDMYTSLVAIFEKMNFRPHIRNYCSSYWTILKMVEEGLGVAIGCTRSWLVNTDLNIRQVHIQGVDAHRSVYLTWPEHAYLTNATLELISYLDNLFTQSTTVSAEDEMAGKR
jgi:LysR family transcriptional activator of glutamate synthase operon